MNRTYERFEWHFAVEGSDLTVKDYSRHYRCFNSIMAAIRFLLEMDFNKFDPLSIRRAEYGFFYTGATLIDASDNRRLCKVVYQNSINGQLPCVCLQLLVTSEIFEVQAGMSLHLLQKNVSDPSLFVLYARISGDGVLHALSGVSLLLADLRSRIQMRNDLMRSA